MKHENTKAPWLDQDGKPHSTETLREISKDWNFETWQNYLCTLEQQGREAFVSPAELERQIERFSLEAYLERSADDVSSKSTCQIRKTLRRSLAGLPPFQKRILKLLYWKDMRVGEIANLLGVDEVSVIYHRRKAEEAVRFAFAQTSILKEVCNG